jgi:hypothetical protein
VSLASRGQRDMDGGAEPIASDAEREQVQRQARQVRRRALAFALVLTVLTLLWPA